MDCEDSKKLKVVAFNDYFSLSLHRHGQQMMSDM